MIQRFWLIHVPALHGRIIHPWLVLRALNVGIGWTNPSYEMGWHVTFPRCTDGLSIRGLFYESLTLESAGPDAPDIIDSITLSFWSAFSGGVALVGPLRF